MAGHGRRPKPKALRQRRNKTGTRTILPASSAALSGAIPSLPSNPCPVCAKADRSKKPKSRCAACSNSGIRSWHPATIAWWKLLWAEPHASEYVKSDVPLLQGVVADLMERIHRSIEAGTAPTPNDQKELRLWSHEFGLSVMARRSLQWEKAETPAPPAAVVDEPTEDPREILRLVGKK